MKIKMINQNKSDCMNATKLGASLSILFVSLMIFASMLFSIQVVSAEYPATFVDLGLSGNFAVLSEDVDAAITNTGSALVYGDMGVSPAAATFIQGFGLLPLDVTGCFSTSPQVPGYKIYASDYNTGACTTPAYLSTAVLNRQAAFTAATDVTANPAAINATYLNLGAGTLTARTLTPGVYTWASDLSITGDITLDCQGNSSSVFVFQIPGNLNLATTKQIILSGGCQASRIFWAVSGTTDFMASSHFEGNLITGPGDLVIVTVVDSATVNGRLLGSALIALQQSTTVTMPVDTNPSVTSPVTSTPVTETNATINWTTDVLSNSTVSFGTTTGLGTNVSNADFVLNHSILLPNLTANTLYFFNVTTCSSIGTCTTDGTFNFTTTNSGVVVTTTTTTHSGGGGGGCTTRYTCTEWSACSTTGTQTRTCSYPANWCEPSVDKPTEFQLCTITATTTPETETIELTDNPTNTAPIKTTPGITGGVIGTGTTAGKVGLIVLIGLVIAGIAGAAVFLIRKYN